MRMQRVGVVCGLCICLGAGGAMSAAPPAAAESLLRNYLRYLLLDYVGTQGERIVAQAPEPRQAALTGTLTQWTDTYQQRIRHDLEVTLGASARPQFEAFVEAFTVAEQARDYARLAEWAQETGAPAGARNDFEAFRRWGIEQWVAAEMEQATTFLAGLDLNAAAVEKPAPAAPRPANPLRAAEAAPPPMQEWGNEQESPLQRYATMRAERRQTATEQAQAGMQQVAAEREAWEQEYAGEIAAKAQAEADAVKRQAERLAATDQEALEQRKNSFGALCVKVLAGAAQSTVAGFTGAVGTRAANEALGAIFD